ncbi:unnamed protein product [Linum trigynum]|uniref:Uncharacterized protein n=1 Tax=Linum trigynum TaxID=586398 RepID=A0AAV2FV61_9ROSI
MNSRLTWAGPHGRVAFPVARVTSKRCVSISCTSGFLHGQGHTAVWITLPGRVKPRIIPHGQTTPSHGRVDIRASRVKARTISHGQSGHLHGRVSCGCARVASFSTCLAPDLRPIDPELAPKPSFTC